MIAKDAFVSRVPPARVPPRFVAGARVGRTTVAAAARQPNSDSPTTRRDALLLSLGVLGGASAFQGPALAVQGLTAGRVPGLGEAEADGFRTYSRPDGKSGGHGIGWSEIPKYSFRVPADGWNEEPVSIADLGGTEIDVRFESKDEGKLAIVVAPVLRFMNVGYNADIRIEDIGSPEKLLEGFAPEILGGPVEEEDLTVQSTMEKGGLTYYVWETKVS